VKRWRALPLAALCLLLAGCGGGNKHARTRVPAPPPTSAETFNIPANAKPLYVETGLASWYGPPYHNRPAANGEIFDMNAPTAAHRTLPLGSIVRVTNLSTGQRTLVRINDRGPFVEGRIIDLSLAAASEIGVRRAGIAKVRVEVMRAPAPLDSGGRWAVQIGALEDEEVAAELKAKLSRRYRTAKVLSFPSPTGDWWVRVRVLQDDRKRAQEVARDTHTPQGDVFLVRLD
jgi:rare lipoprotein A